MPLLIFGHRGAAGEAPENTMVGFNYAYDTARVRCFELDVHLTKDGQLAVIHDPLLDRTTDGKGPVGHYSLAELKRFNAGLLFPGKFTHAKIPTLHEVLDEFADKISFFQIEIKTDTEIVLNRVADLVLQAIDTYKIREKTVVTSFDPYAITRIRLTDPTQHCGLIAMEYSEEDLLKAIGLGCYNTCIRITTANGKDLVAKAQSYGLQTTGWLGNTAEDVDTLLSWGVDSITTNYPSAVRTYVQQTLGLEII